MTDDLRVRREITLVLEGPIDLVHKLSTYVLRGVPVDVTSRSQGKVRYQIQNREDFLDDAWQVIPAADIVAAATKERKATT